MIAFITALQNFLHDSQKTRSIAMFCLALMLPAGVILAATTPSSGTLSLTNTTIAYTGGPFAVSNRSTETGEIPPGCVADQTCSEFALTINIPSDDFNAYRLKLRVEWTNSGTTTMGGKYSNYDIYVYSPDLTGGEVAAVASPDNPEETSFIAGSGNYTVYVRPI